MHIDYRTYKLIHLMALFALFLAFGAVIGNRGEKRIWPGLLHGLALLFVLVAGFGMLGAMGMRGGLPGWVIGELITWFLLGASLVAAKRRLVPAIFLIPALIFLGGVGTYLALWKP